VAKVRNRNSGIDSTVLGHNATMAAGHWQPLRTLWHGYAMDAVNAKWDFTVCLFCIWPAANWPRLEQRVGFGQLLVIPHTREIPNASQVLLHLERVA